MRLKVYLSPLAEFKLDLLLQSLKVEWGDKVKNNFLESLAYTLERLSHNPKLYPVSQIKDGIRKCVVSPQTSFYYRIKEEDIEIITIIDNRQNPDKIAEEIKDYFTDVH